MIDIYYSKYIQIDQGVISAILPPMNQQWVR